MTRSINIDQAIVWVGAAWPGVCSQVDILGLCRCVCHCERSIGEAFGIGCCGIIGDQEVRMLHVGRVAVNFSVLELSMEGCFVNEENAIVGILVADCLLKCLVPAGRIIVVVISCVVLVAPWVSDFVELDTLVFNCVKYCVEMPFGKANA